MTKREHEKLDKEHYRLMQAEMHDGWVMCRCDIAKKIRAFHGTPEPRGSGFAPEAPRDR